MQIVIFHLTFCRSIWFRTFRIVSRFLCFCITNPAKFFSRRRKFNFPPCFLLFFCCEQVNLDTGSLFLLFLNSVADPESFVSVGSYLFSHSGPKKHDKTLPSKNCLQCTVHNRESAKAVKNFLEVHFGVMNRRQIEIL